jgi:hypothetical protein
MTQERIDLLNDLGIAWNAQEAKWFAKFDELTKYKELNGDCLVPKVYQPNPSLGLWVRYFEENKCIICNATLCILNNNS